jgi:hypothetical protein
MFPPRPIEHHQGNETAQNYSSTCQLQTKTHLPYLDYYLEWLRSDGKEHDHVSQERNLRSARQDLGSASQLAIYGA